MLLRGLLQLWVMVTPTGLEPVTCPLGGGCSIQLSHGAMIVLLTADARFDKVVVGPDGR